MMPFTRLCFFFLFNKIHGLLHLEQQDHLQQRGMRSSYHHQLAAGALDQELLLTEEDTCTAATLFLKALG